MDGCLDRLFLSPFVFLTLVTYFKVKDIWALFLVGAAFGWLAEGVIVLTTYEMLPLSISFTGLAWHALITVWIGWYALRKSFVSAASFSTLKLSAVIGAWYGLWAISWWLEPDGGVSSVADFATFSLVTTIFIILAYWLDGRNYHALSNICTHLGCRVRWIAEREQFLSPCHNGVFDKHGYVVSGPPPRPLDEFETKIENGNLYIQLPALKRTG